MAFEYFNYIRRCGYKIVEDVVELSHDWVEGVLDDYIDNQYLPRFTKQYEKPPTDHQIKRERDFIKTGLYSKLARAVGNRCLPTDKLVECELDIDFDGSIKIDAIVERENVKYTFITFSTTAGGYGMKQCYHYRYLTCRSSLPCVNNNFEKKIKALEREKSLKQDVAREWKSIMGGLNTLKYMYRKDLDGYMEQVRAEWNQSNINRKEREAIEGKGTMSDYYDKQTFEDSYKYEWANDYYTRCLNIWFAKSGKPKKDAVKKYMKKATKQYKKYQQRLFDYQIENGLQ